MYVNFPWPQLSERLEEWKIKADEMKGRLKETIRQKKYYDLDAIKVEAITMKNEIQQEDDYHEFLLTQENKNINLKILRGLFYEDVYESISYDQHLISIGALKDGLKEAYEQKIEQLQNELSAQHRNQVEQMVNDHTAEIRRFQAEIQNLEREKQDLVKLNASDKIESNAKIDELSRNFLGSKDEKESLEKEHVKAIEVLKNELEELQNTIKYMEKSHKDRIFDLSSENADLSSKNDALQVKIDTLKIAHKDEMKQLRVQNSQFEAQNEDLKSQNDHLEQNICDLKSQAKDLIDKFSVKEKEHQAEVTELSSKNAELGKTIEECKAEIENMKVISNPLFYENEELHRILPKFYEDFKYRLKDLGYEELKEGSQLSTYHFEEFYCDYTDYEKINRYSELVYKRQFKCNDEQHSSLLKLLSIFILPDNPQLTLLDVPENSEEVKHFLSNLKMNELKEFTFRGDKSSLNKDLIDITPYVESLKKV
jgi:uncharacterized protein YukE